MKKIFFLLPLFLLLTGCGEKTVYGVDETVWEGMTPAQQTAAMNHYYEKEQREEERRERQAEIAAETERQRIQEEAKTAPIQAAVNLIDIVANKGRGHKQHHSKSSGLYISKVKSSIGTRTLTLSNGRKFEISPFIGHEIDHWMEEQRVQVTKEGSGLYPLRITNVDTGDTVNARKA